MHEAGHKTVMRSGVAPVQRPIRHVGQPHLPDKGGGSFSWRFDGWPVIRILSPDMASYSAPPYSHVGVFRYVCAEGQLCIAHAVQCSAVQCSAHIGCKMQFSLVVQCSVVQMQCNAVQ
jgi:hypothetical protein